jgi:predicted enzyme related to lactoylglutathione lyase
MATPGTGSFCWFELGTNNQPAAVAFYQKLFGWTVQDSPIGPGEVYSMFKLNGEDAAAAFTLRPEQRANGVPPHWMIYVAVDDADQIATRAATLGATIVAPPFDVFDFGRMAVIQDPTGAMFSIWQAKQHAGVGVWGASGSASWGDLSTPDQTRAGDFYTQLFGWRMVTGKDMVEAAPGDYFHIMNGADMIGGVGPASQRDPNTPPHWLVYFEAASCGETTAKATGLGATAYVQNMQIGESGWISVLADPQGAMFGIHATKA